MVGEAFAAFQGLKIAFDSVKAIKEMNDANIRNAAISDVLEKLVTAREQYSALLDRVSDLEQELKRFENWEAEKQRYQLHRTGRGNLAYVVKKSMANGEPGHALCPKCFQESKKSILQPNNASFVAAKGYVCPSCAMDIITQSEGFPTFAEG